MDQELCSLCSLSSDHFILLFTDGGRVDSIWIECEDICYSYMMLFSFNWERVYLYLWHLRGFHKDHISIIVIFQEESWLVGSYVIY